MSGNGDQRPDKLKWFTLSLHLGLMLATGMTMTTVELSLPAKLGLILLLLAPLAACLKGLIAVRRVTLQWLALALVFYAGLGTVEVIATGTLAAAALLLFALLELGLVLMLSRRA